MLSFLRIGRRTAKWVSSFTLRRTRLPWLVAASVLLGAILLALTRSACADPASVHQGSPRRYTLGECLELAERNHPAIEAAGARLAFMRGQIDEARAAPWSFLGLNSRFGVVPNSPKTTQTSEAPSLAHGIGPFFQIAVNATIPLYTFGKIDGAKRAAEAQARLGEWDIEKERLQIRTDVRRAFYGVELARDMIHLASETLDKLNDSLSSLVKKLESGDTSVEQTDRWRLEVSRDELLARVAEARRGESAGLAALRFFTGIQSDFELPDEPLTPPETPLGPVVQYLTTARVNRPDVNRARAGAVARRAQVDVARANLLPNLGLGMRFDWAVAPGIETPVSGGFDPSAANHLNYGAAFGLDWSLDFFTKSARLEQAKSNLDEARALERLALGGVATEVEVAYAAALEATTRADNWDHAVRRAKGWIADIESAIDLGTKDERSLLEPLRVYVGARANQLQAWMDTRLTRAELVRVSGATM
jgi:outer membrane protein TolC